MHKSLLSSLSLALLAGLGSSGAQAVSFTHEGVTLDINGTVNGFYVNREEKTTDRRTGASTTKTNSALSNGLLPGWINFVATTQIDGQDIKAHFSFAPGINNNSQVVGLPIGNNANGAGNVNPYSQIDTRNVYFQFGNAQWGTLKFGRDIGLFGQNVILSDMTLLGVGGTSNAGIPYNTTFGMIGHGYMYTGFQPQITYSTPKLGGWQAAAGIFQPSNFAGDQTKTPGFQAKVDYDWGGQLPGKVWTGLVSQSTQCAQTPCATQSFSATGFELGGKVKIGNFETLAYAFNGKGLGLSTVGAQFFGGSNNAGSKTDSRGYFLQGTYQWGKTKIGLNFGENRDKDGFALTGAGNSNEIRNRAYTFGVYHALNKMVTLVGEINQERVSNILDSNKDSRSRTLSIGGILFF